MPPSLCTSLIKINDENLNPLSKTVLWFVALTIWFESNDMKNGTTKSRIELDQPKQNHTPN